MDALGNKWTTIRVRPCAKLGGLPARGKWLLALVTAALGAPASAAAAVTHTAVTAPGSGYTAAFDTGSGASNAPITISGTSDGAPGDQLDVRCYDGPNPADFNAVLDKPLAVGSGGAWSTGPVSPAGIAGTTCTLRAVAPGATPSDLSAFAGPVIGVDTIQRLRSGSIPTDYRFLATQHQGQIGYRSVGRCGVDQSYWLSSAFQPSDRLFSCVAALYGVLNYTSGLGASDRSEIVIDGHDAYAPYAAAVAYNDGTNASSASTGLPSVTLAQSVDPTTGDVSLHETEQIVKCPDAAAGATNYPPSHANCAGFQTADVRFDRFVSGGADGLQTTVTDDWSSADGLAHTLDLAYDHGLGDNTQLGHAPQYRFPGEAAYSPHATGDALPGGLPAPAALLVALDPTLPAGDPGDPVGAISWDTPPIAGVFTDARELTFGDVYRIPAGGAVVLRYVLSQAPTESALAGLVKAAQQILSLPARVPAAPGGGPTLSGVQALRHQQPRGLAGGRRARCIVPRLRGLTRRAAARRLARAHCRLGKVRFARSRTRKGRVVRSRPRAGARRRSGTRVAITISRGSAKPTKRRSTGHGHA